MAFVHIMVDGVAVLVMLVFTSFVYGGEHGQDLCEPRVSVG